MNITRWYGNMDPKTDYRAPEAIFRDLRALGCSVAEAELVVDEVCSLRGGRSRREVLATRLAKLCKTYEDQISNARADSGPRGGHNAARIESWVKSPNQDISKAMPGWARRPGWKGGCMTPTQYIPKCISAKALLMWREVYCG